MLQIDMLNRSR